MTLLAIDAGNTRVKWALFDGAHCKAEGAVPTTQAAAIACSWSAHGTPQRAIGCNVAGMEVQAVLEGVLSHLGVACRWVYSQPRQCGVINGYDDAARLGADRWAALIAARQRMRHATDLYSACVILSAGTAVTIDALTSAGHFLGGVIIPGHALMCDALAQNTAALRREAGSFRLLPTNTADAIYTGAFLAIGGALARVERALRVREQGHPQLIITGGGAPALQPTLERDAQWIPNLVLEGLRVLADAVD